MENIISFIQNEEQLTELDLVEFEEKHKIKLTGNRIKDNRLAYELSNIKPTDDILDN